MSKPNATRKPYSRRLSLGITNSLVDKMISQKHHQEYLENKRIYNESFEGQIDRVCRGVLQETSKSMEEINKQYVENVSKLVDRIVEETQTLLSEQYGDLENLTFKQVEDYMRVSNIVFITVDSMCKNSQYLSIVKNNQSNDYERLFKRLIQEVNPQFIVFAPNKLVELRTIYKGMGGMPVEAKERLFARVKALGLDKDYRYMETHSSVFNEIINPQQKTSKTKQEANI